ncbi:DUF6164 family protein [Halomonas lysinitropha]|uniref:DUF2007 domain-containing protein n=1 Tax=Halomonas lysinitropha TaxID=2607506 RepID=A0A5K1HXM6_9GAMM|nr:DUF6164 family protein [Halomonas lysinitropha]VVZ94015.1 hypothetical protein HALO32_00064 [Halomonas lysinitropha]
MAVLLFHLRHVPDEEAEEVRRLLDEHSLDTFETRAGFWGMGVAAIWLRDPHELPRARALIDAYQHALGERMRHEHDVLAARGEAPTLWRRLTRQPIRTLLFALLAAGVLALSLLPFLWMAG